MSKPEPKTIDVTVQMVADSGDMYLKQDWISGKGGGKEFDMATVINGPIVQIKVGSRYFDCNLTPLIQAALAQ